MRLPALNIDRNDNSNIVTSLSPDHGTLIALTQTGWFYFAPLHPEGGELDIDQLYYMGYKNIIE